MPGADRPKIDLWHWREVLYKKAKALLYGGPIKVINTNVIEEDEPIVGLCLCSHKEVKPGSADDPNAYRHFLITTKNKWHPEDAIESFIKRLKVFMCERKPGEIVYIRHSPELFSRKPFRIGEPERLYVSMRCHVYIGGTNAEQKQKQSKPE